jgi:hypothetical protein
LIIIVLKIPNIIEATHPEISCWLIQQVDADKKLQFTACVLLIALIILHKQI